MKIAALPMYDLPGLRSAHDALWTTIAEHLIAAGIDGVPKSLDRSLGHYDSWRHPELLLAQACEYPLATELADSVRLVATPIYKAPGCQGATYRSAIVVRKSDEAASLRDMRDTRCVVNETSSNSGMNLLRGSIAPLAGGRRFFRSVKQSGSHRDSLAMIVRGEADVAAIDCVTFALLQRHDPALTDGVRILDWTASSPSLPYITAGSADDRVVEALRNALNAAVANSALYGVRDTLLLEGFDCAPDNSFGRVLKVSEDAGKLNYKTLA